MPGLTIIARVVAAVEARFKTITPGAGYNFDLSSKVFVWRVADFAEAELPALNLIYPKVTTKNLNTMGHQEHELEFEAHVVNSATAGDSAAAKTTKLNAAEIMELDADLTKAIGVDPKWTVADVALAVDTNPGTTEIEVLQDKITVAGLNKKFTVKFRTRRFDPYNHP